MSPSIFEELLSFVSPHIMKQSAAMRDPVGPSERLAVTLCFIIKYLNILCMAYSHKIVNRLHL